MVSADRRVPTYVHIALNNLPQLSTVNDVAARTSTHDQADAAGVGKTTLAHVAARHCGYRVVEINASDERSRGALLSAVAAAVQMQPVLGDRRPNCLVIDEIDGALGGTTGRAGGGAPAAGGARGRARGPHVCAHLGGGRPYSRAAARLAAAWQHARAVPVTPLRASS